MRKCVNCEYFRQISTYLDPNCHFNPPTVSGEHQHGRFPIIKKDFFCSKWEPRWDNPMINKAWKEFLLVVKLSREGNEE